VANPTRFSSWDNFAAIQSRGCIRNWRHQRRSSAHGVLCGLIRRGECVAGSGTLKTMGNAEIQIVSNQAGEPTAVIVPIELWREIESERETAYLLKSETMKQRLLAAKQRQEGLSLEAVVEKLRI